MPRGDHQPHGEGDWVIDHETAHGLADEPVRVLVAYRVRAGLIDRVHFFG